MFINPLLEFYKTNNLGFKHPTCADDIVLLSKSQQELQTMHSSQEQFANDERYIISKAKTKIMVFNKKPIGDIPENFILHDQLMENVKSYRNRKKTMFARRR